MCGIIGYVGGREAKPLLLEMLSPPRGWIERRAREWLLHLVEHDPGNATPGFACELAQDDLRIALAYEGGGVQ